MSPEDSPSPPAVVPSPPPSLGTRLLYMVILALVFWILCWMLAITVLVQLVLTLLAGRPNVDLVRFGASLAAYSRQVIEFLTFVSDRVPFPFSDWPAS
jgi:uncharacterized RDD family membrane protein YckC